MVELWLVMTKFLIRSRKNIFQLELDCRKGSWVLDWVVLAKFGV